MTLQFFLCWMIASIAVAILVMLIWLFNNDPDPRSRDEAGPNYD